MCNEREESIWFINQKSDGLAGDTITVSASDGICTTSNTVYTKNDHDEGGIGLNRKFDPELVGDIDRIYRANWNLPEYLPFRECIRMGIQDGIVAGRKSASGIIAEKDRQIADAKSDAEHWKNAFVGLLAKCREGMEVFEFIAKLVHVGNSTKDE